MLASFGSARFGHIVTERAAATAAVVVAEQPTFFFLIFFAELRETFQWRLSGLSHTLIFLFGLK